MQVLVDNNNNNLTPHMILIIIFNNANIINFLNDVVNRYNIYITFNKKITITTGHDHLKNSIYNLIGLTC
jgi:hypothetical protein